MTKLLDLDDLFRQNAIVSFKIPVISTRAFTNEERTISLKVWGFGVHKLWHIRKPRLLVTRWSPASMRGSTSDKRARRSKLVDGTNHRSVIVLGGKLSLKVSRRHQS